MGRPGPRRSERGVTAVLVAIVLVVLGGFLALALNVGHSRAVRGQLQSAVDAGALAGAAELDGTLAPLTAGRPGALASTFTSRHITDRSIPVEIDPSSDVVPGHWDPFAADPATAFTPISPILSEEDARRVNAVRVLAGREGSRGNAVGVDFSSFVTTESMDVSAEAVAVNGGPCEDSCPDAPLAFFACGIEDPETYALACGKTLRIHFSPDGSDTAGLSSLSLDSANTQTYRDIISGDLCRNLQAGDQVNISNGQQGSTTLCGPENNQPTFDHYCRADAQGACTEPREVRAPVVDGECPPRFNQTHQVIGFATFRFVRMVCGGASNSYIDVEFLCDEVDDEAGVIGCGWFGTGPLRPKLVR